MTRRLLRSVLAGLLTLALVALGPRGGLQAATPAMQAVTATGSVLIPIREQPFYPELEAIAERWRDNPLNRVVGESPRDTLLNFYAVMARAYQLVQTSAQLADRDPGFGWSADALKRIAGAEQLFDLAVQALDANSFPESVRQDRAEEAALQLKEVLDYVFSHSTVPIEIPDAAGLKAYNEQRSRSSESWTLPSTSITLTNDAQEVNNDPGFVFSSTTVNDIGRMYTQIQSLAAVQQPFASSGFYNSFIHTPGFLSPPKWYLRLPADLRSALEISLDGQTVLQIAAALTTLLFYSWVLKMLLGRLLHTYRYWQSDQLRSDGRRPWHQDNLAWYRVLLTIPLLPLTRISEAFIDDYVNFTGAPLLVTTYLFYICYFIAAGCFFFFLFEALGRTLSERLVQWRGGNSDLQLRRISNLIMPVCRALGGLGRLWTNGG